MSPVKKFINRLGHLFIAGMTRSGKTYFALQIMAAWPGPVLFFNPQGEKVGAMIHADGKVSTSVIVKALRQGKKISYVPDIENQKVAMAELALLVGSVVGSMWPGRGLLFVVDECQDFAPQGKTDSPVYMIARRGLRWGITGCFIAQSPADVAKVVCRQAENHYIFHVDDYDRAYYSRYHIPGEDIEQRIAAGGPYSFCLWSQGVVEGPLKV